VEKLLVSLFDSKCHLIGDGLLATGSVKSVQVSPREIFMLALRQGAVSVILLHNHPSGDPTPSRDDIYLTGRIRECGELLGIELSDHIIIGDNRYYSFRENKQIIV
jgi:DNA repair protein RadC